MPYSRLASGPKGVDAYILSSSSGNDNSGRAPLSEKELARRFKPNRRPPESTLQARTAEVELEYARAVRSCKAEPKNIVSLIPDAPAELHESSMKPADTEEKPSVESVPAVQAPRSRKRARVLEQLKESYDDSAECGLDQTTKPKS